MDVRPDAVGLGLVLLVAGLLRLAFFPRAPVFIAGDSHEYYLPAYALMTGLGEPLPLARPPAYSLLLALVGGLFGPDLRILIAFQHVLGLATAGLAYAVGRLTFGRLTGLLAGLAAALDGGLLIYEHSVMTESSFTFLITTATLLVLLAARRDRVRYAAAAGVLLGLAILFRPHAQVLVVAGLGAALLTWRLARPVARACGLTALAAMVVILPWMVRNAVVHESFTVAQALGRNLAYLSVIRHTGAFTFFDPARPPPDVDWPRHETARLLEDVQENRLQQPWRKIGIDDIVTELIEELGVSEADADRLLGDVVLRAVRERPLVYARMAAEDTWGNFAGEPEDLRRHWKLGLSSEGPDPRVELFTPASPEQEASFDQTEQLVNLYQSPWLGALQPLLFVVGLLVAALVRRWRLALIPAAAVLGLHAASAAVSGSIERFHHPPDPLLQVLVVGGLVGAGSLLARRSSRQTCPAPDRWPVPHG